MSRYWFLCGALMVAVALVPAPPAQAQTDDCQAAEREMAYGAAAMEDARDKAGFLRAARQFEGAIRSAPRCAAARFNLGVVYEKAGELQAAKGAYGHYLRLAPNAADARAVRQRMYKLEYRIGRAANTQKQKRREEARPIRLAGEWCELHPMTGDPLCDSTRLEIDGTKIEIFKKILRISQDRMVWFPRYRGFVQGSNIRGSYFSDADCPDMGTTMTGTISNDGQRIELFYKNPTSWQGDYCTINKTSNDKSIFVRKGRN